MNVYQAADGPEPAAALGCQRRRRSPLDPIGELREIVGDCVHCGFCLPACPTYQLWGEEMDSPRGRIHLIGQLLDGASASPAAAAHLDRCLGCMACVPACPSGVRYDRLIEAARSWAADPSAADPSAAGPTAAPGSGPAGATAATAARRAGPRAPAPIGAGARPAGRDLRDVPVSEPAQAADGPAPRGPADGRWTG